VRDYAKKTSRPMKKNNTVNGTWLLTLLITGTILFVGYTGYHFVHQKLLAKKEDVSMDLTTTAKTASVFTSSLQTKQIKMTLPIKQATKKTEPPKKSAMKTERSAPTSNEPKYDFYKILPAMTVTIPTQDEPTQTLSTPETNKAVNTTSLGSYVLQVASLQTQEDADQVSNALRAVGYTAFVQHYQASDHSTWYRVMVGPFKTIKAAQVQQAKLYAHQNEALLLKITLLAPN